jgi:hypothetical protein
VPKTDYHPTTVTTKHRFYQRLPERFPERLPERFRTTVYNATPTTWHPVQVIPVGGDGEVEGSVEDLNQVQ